MNETKKKGKKEEIKEHKPDHLNPSFYFFHDETNKNMMKKSENNIINIFKNFISIYEIYKEEKRKTSIFFRSHIKISDRRPRLRRKEIRHFQSKE